MVRVFAEAGQKWAWLMETLPVCIYIYIYIYIERERERERQRDRETDVYTT